MEQKLQEKEQLLQENKVQLQEKQEELQKKEQASFYAAVGPSKSVSLYYQQVFYRPVRGTYAWKLDYLVTCYVQSQLEVSNSDSI